MSPSSESEAQPSGGTPLTLREEQKQMTRDRLIAAGLETFRREGYAKATVEDIAAAAGASRATFYLHFRTKADVARALIAPLLHDSARLYEQLNEIMPLTREGLRTWLERSVSYWERHSAVSEVVQQVLGADPEIASEVMQDRVSRSLNAVLDFVARNSGRSPEDAHVRGAMLYFGIERFCFFWLVRGLPGAEDRTAVVEALTDLWWEAVQPRD